MRTFETISNEHLFIAAVRRLRTRKVISGGRTAPEGTRLEKIIPALCEAGLMSLGELKEVISHLLETGDVIITGYSTFREPNKHRSSGGARGLITKLHPDSKLSERMYFTLSNTPIIEKRSKEGARLYPNDTVSYRAVILKRVYVVADGLPAAVTPLLKREPAQPY